jgi:catechol 2,3-dioxygenase-like lactoylglutathione lyase family enzyme
LDGAELVAFVSTTDPQAARRFYRDRLGLRLLEDGPFALVFDANGVTLRVSVVEAVQRASYTVLGWRVADIAAQVGQLADAGVEFLRFDGMEQDDRGVWQSPGGDMVAWFSDPDGNVLSVTQAVTPLQ